MLEVQGLKKSFGAIVALEDVSLTVRPGTIVGLLGPNGAGKTTTVSIVAGLLPPDAGEVRIDGTPLQGDADPRKRTLGIVPQELALYEELTAEDNLRFFGALYGLGRAELDARIGAVLAVAGLSDRQRSRVKTFSGGMKRRLNLAAGLLHEPRILLLDEPTAGVDPQSRNALFENLEALRGEGKAILYTTHYMEEAERLCDRIVIVDHGRVMADDTLEGLEALLPRGSRLVLELAGEAAPHREPLEGLPDVESVEAEGSRLVVRATALAAAAERALALLAARGAVVTAINSETPRLEEIFLALTGRDLRDE